jgi:uncharacterized membrane protein
MWLLRARAWIRARFWFIPALLLLAATGLAALTLFLDAHLDTEGLTGGSVLGWIQLGHARTAEQDLDFALSQLVELALRATSPAINDPFTASRSIDRLSAALRRLARRVPPPARRFDQDGALRVVVRRVELPDAIDAVFDPLRGAARQSAVVCRRLIDAVVDLSDGPLDARARDRLRGQAAGLRAAADGHEEPDRGALLARAEEALAAAERPAPAERSPAMTGARGAAS